MFDRLLRAYLPEDEIQSRLLAFVPPGSCTFRLSHLVFSFRLWDIGGVYLAPAAGMHLELDRARHACFAHPEHSLQTPAPQRGQRRRSWRNLFSRGFSATTSEVPQDVFESIKVIVNEDDGEPHIEYFSVCPSRTRDSCGPYSPWKFQDHEWSDEAKVKETLSTLAHSLGFDLAKRLVYRIQEWS